MSPIALNGRFSGTAQPTGTQTVGFGLFDAIIRSDRPRPVVVFADPRFPGVAAWAEQPRTTLVPVPFQDWSRGRAQLWEQFIFPILARHYGCVLGHHPITTGPFWHLGLKTVITLHDLNFYRYPQWYSRSFRLAFRFCALPGLHRADRVVTISDYVCTQAKECLGLRPERVARIYNGVKPVPQSSLPREKTPYLLCVGSLQPHKNLPRLIQAYQRLRPEFPHLELWVVGRPQPRFSQQPELTALLTSPGIKVLGYLSESDLARTYRDAQVFCYPSLEEGFGLPLLEAMLAGTLVVTSNLSCLPEIAGPAALLTDPMSEQALADSLRQALQFTGQEREQRLAQGLAWAEKFTWTRAAQDYLKLYEELLA